MDRTTRSLLTNMASFSSVGANDQGTLLHKQYPYYSTPHVSPGPHCSTLNQNQSQSSNSIMQTHKANLKLPVGPLAPQEQFSEFPKPRIISRANGIRKKKKNNLTSASLSPILLNDSFRHCDILQFTDPRALAAATRELFSGTSEDNDSSIIFPVEDRGIFGQYTREAESLRNLADGAQCVFPYPEVEPGFECCEEPAETLCNQLKVLAAFKRLDYEKNRLLGTKKEKAEEVVPYVFSEVTFFNVNSDASIHALHLLFSSYDPKETEQRFRDCWPVYEKKEEGIFRRVALEWMKQMILENPTFFKDVRHESLAGLLVQPGGDRFISALSQFCRFVMYSVANQKKDLVKQQVLLPSTIFDDPEITNRQLQVLKTRTLELTESGVNCYLLIMKSEQAVKRRMKMLDDMSNLVSQNDELYSSRLRSIISMHPAIFGNPSEDELAQRDEEVSHIKITQLIEDVDYNDFIKDGLIEALHKQTEEIYKPVSFLQDIMEDYSKIWHVLDMDRANPVMLECGQVLPYLIKSSTGEPLLNTFIDSLATVVKDLSCNSYLNSDVPKEILAEYEAFCLRVQFLDMLQDQVEEAVALTKPAKVAKILQRAKTRREVLKARLAEYDWTKISKIQESGHSKLWDMTPIRVYDINKSSGRTPGINNFLDLSVGYSSYEQQSSIVKRRSASINKQRRYRPSDSDSSTPTRSVATVSHNISEAIAHSKTKGNVESTSILSPSCQINDRVSTHQQQLPLTLASPQSMRKSVSFGNTSMDLSRLSISNRFSMSMSMSSSHSLTPNQSSQRLSLSRIENNTDISTLESDVPLGLDSSTQDRVHRLLESIAPNNNHRRSQSPPENVDIETDTTTIEKSLRMSSSNDEINTCKRMSTGISLNEADADATELFGDLSLIEEWEATKGIGIMDVSNIELLQNSDSDE